jgi:peptide/nickel transport system ATP-binding protein
VSAIAEVTGLTIAVPGGRTVLDGVDLELTTGQVTGLVGASGAGKSTVAHALLGHLGRGLRLSGGIVRVDGRDPFTPRGRRELRGRITAYLPQDPAGALDPARTVAGQLRTAARIAHPSVSRPARRALVEEATRAAAFEPALLGRYPARLSGGQAQRALLAWTHVTRPRLLILDEPTSGLDPDTAYEISQTFARLPWDPAVLLISHDRELVDRVCDHVLQLADGHLRPAEPIEPTPRETASGGIRCGDAVLSMTGVELRRGGRVLLTDAALHLAAGEMVAVRGPSGSGKTALARALCGLAPPHQGTLRLHDADVPWDAVTRARSGGPYLAYVGQDARAALHPTESIGRSLHRALQAARRCHRAGPVDPARALSLVGLDHTVLDRTPDQLSGGERHRAVLARAVAASPAVLVCDETTAALDRRSTDHVLDALEHLRHATGLPVVVITHQDPVANRADRVLTLAEGQLQ